MGTIPLTWLWKHYDLVIKGIIVSWLHGGKLTLYVFSVFRSPFDMATFFLPLNKNSPSNHELLKDDQVHVYTFRKSLNQPKYGPV